MPCHHALAEALHAYINAAGIAEDRKGFLFRTARGHNGTNSKPPAIRLAVCSAASEKAPPCLSSTESRHIRTPAEASSMRLSMPNAVRLMLRAAIPEARAITASTVIHAIVNHSRRNASPLDHIVSGREQRGGAMRPP